MNSMFMATVLDYGILAIIVICVAGLLYVMFYENLDFKDYLDYEYDDTESEEDK